MKIEQKKINTSIEHFSLVLLKMLDEDIDIMLTVTGDSMFPLWRHRRDRAVLSKCDRTALKKGDIVFYQRRNGKYVMHRIIKVNQDSYCLCGDAQTEIEDNLSQENIIAVVKAFTRKGKEYSCSNSWYRLYTFVWIGLLPFRKILLGGYRKLRCFFKPR